MPFDPAALKRFRLNADLTQIELARRAGLHPVTTNVLECGRAAPSLDSVERLARALSVPIDALFSAEVSDGQR